MSLEFRTEHDSLGPVQVPYRRLYGAQTVRVMANFPLSRHTIADMPTLIAALAKVKKAAALTIALFDTLAAQSAEPTRTASSTLGGVGPDES